MRKILDKLDTPATVVADATLVADATVVAVNL